MRASNKRFTKLVTYMALFMPACVLAKHDDVIESRQEAFSIIETKTDEAVELIGKSEIDWNAALKASDVLVENSGLLFNAFPHGSESGSKAKALVWSKPEKFDALLVELHNGYVSFQQGSKEQDLSLAEQGLKQAEKTCRSCHRSYRSRW
ncbi:cytochrome c [Vibrio penaeicida]|uniref:c-type cytochrome n=1 Tax=Vibrio penaeicida TaxID=104609 RepID=UPI002734F01C|nr:cytochrome c [Vibrio penaeicida]MDP2573308.1 cytochrome c [Vibrio penaeicida]